MSSLAVLVLATAPGALAQLTFEDASSAAGLLSYQMLAGMGGGVAAADYDDDGDIDFFLPSAAGVADQLYRNRGDGTFEEVAAAAGLDSTLGHRVALWFDADADGLLDLVVGGDCLTEEYGCPHSEVQRFYRQAPGGVFVEDTAAAGLGGDDLIGRGEHRGGFAAGDIDNDGDVDLYTSFWYGRSRLYRNDGGTFTEIALESGLGLDLPHHQAVMFDVDGNGYLDIYAAIDARPNRLWLGSESGVFVDVAPQADADNSWNDMGLTLGDADNDGDFDLYITNIERTIDPKHNLLLRNDSTPAAALGDGVDFTPLASSGTESGGWGWGNTFFDADLDGDLDLAATNGWNIGFESDTSRFFRNDDPAGLGFTDISSEVAFDDPYWGSSLLSIDFDRDGDLDLLQTCNGVEAAAHRVRLLENRLDSGAWLTVVPRMPGSGNPRALGAVVRALQGGAEQIRPITAGISYLGQEPAEAHFGFPGSPARLDRLEIEWPSGGGLSALGGQATGQRLVVASSTLFADGFESGDLAGWR